MSLTSKDYQLVFITGFLTQISCWTLHQFMERKMGMKPSIMTSDDLQKGASTKANPDKAYEVSIRLTRSLDQNGKYRTQTRGAISFVKAIYTLTLFIVFVTSCISYPQWFMDHFIYLKADSTYFSPLLHVCATLIGFYSWEVIVTQYGKLSWSPIIHHWVTAAVALSILMGIYTPFATWYGFTMVSMMFPADFMLGFRAQYCFQYPEFTRKGLAFSRWWVLFALSINFLGQNFLILNAVLYHYNESIHVSMIIVMCFAICCWLFGDIYLVRALRAFSQLDYEEADFLSNVINLEVNAHRTDDGQGGSLEIIGSVKTKNDNKCSPESVAGHADSAYTLDGPNDPHSDQKAKELMDNSMGDGRPGHITTMNSSTIVIELDG